MQVLHNVSLKPYNTFGLDVKAAAFCAIENLYDLKELLVHSEFEKFMIIGGGSNLLLCNDYEGLVVLNKIKGRQLEREDDQSVYLKVYSGENWHETVMHCVNNNWGGLENLSLIPGTIGAAPMQNIGAYGVELEQVFVELEAMDLESFELVRFNHTQCQFGYRESVFKRELKGRYFIYSVTLKLSRHPKVNVQYGDIIKVLEDRGLNPQNAGIKDVSDAIIQIRQSKLPDPAVLGNSGSFFKNPSVSVSDFEKLSQQFPDIKGYNQENGVKIPAAWLIESCGWKGKRVGNTGSHAKQALVLVNYGGAKGDEVHALAMDIIHSVKEKFGIQLEPEVNIIR